MEEKRVLGGLYINDSEAFHKGVLDGMSRTLKANKHDSACIERTIVSSRGRNPDNPSDRATGSPTEQRLEPNSQGICNTLTGVSKDNYLMERNILTTKRTEYGKRIRKDYESGKIQESRHNMTELHPRSDSISNTITTVQKDNLVMETVRIKQATKDGYIECEIGGVADLSYPNSKTRRGRVQERGKICPTLTAQNQEIHKTGQILSDQNKYGTVLSDNVLSSTLQSGTHGYENNCITTKYRIRKLTPKETWRLMNFSDKDFEKAAEVNSGTQLYKQAGNSIVRAVLMAIFSQLNIQGIKPWNDRTIEEREDMLKGRDND